MEHVDIVIVNGFLYAKRRDGTMLAILVDTYDSPYYGHLKVKDGSVFDHISKEDGECQLRERRCP